MTDQPTDIVVRVAVLEERSVAGQEALRLQAAEYERRLGILNDAHARAQDKERDFVQFTIFDTIINELRGLIQINREAITLAVPRTMFEDLLRTIATSRLQDEDKLDLRLQKLSDSSSVLIGKLEQRVSVLEHNNATLAGRYAIGAVVIAILLTVVATVLLRVVGR